MKVVLRGRSTPVYDLVLITEENKNQYPRCPVDWYALIDDDDGVIAQILLPQTVERGYEPAPIRFDSSKGWLDREPKRK